MSATVQNQSRPLQVPPFALARELAAGGVSMMVASVTLNPTDVVKVRLQVQPLNVQIYTSTMQGFGRILREEGLWGLWRPGLAASAIRELSYSSIRMGMYPVVKEFYTGDRQGDPGLLRKVLAGLTTGALGSTLANPTDLVKIRLQGEAGRVVDGVYVTGLRTGHRPTYRNTFDAFVRIAQQEGIWAGLYRGVEATTIRAAFLTAAQLSSYDHAKIVFKRNKILEEGVPLHIICSLISGLCATTAAAPADVIKSRIMDSRKAATTGGIPTYTSVWDCVVKTMRNEGPLAFFKGWLPSYMRIGPHFLLSLPLYEQIRKAFGLGNM